MWHRCGTDGHWHKPLMSTDRWHCWDYIDHQGTLIITVRVTVREERNADNRNFLVYM
ncbi:unnamed protein product [Staurois parvus]|uniref:Uncharacterized protein n=1 Tax=Staurois parvus TaxID=386267 RepID=A0ABN9ECV8_9NEOB|nr:unnamed protein product [Staurois parvus]